MSVDGTRSDSIGYARVELTLDANKLTVNWFGTNGKPVKSVPQSVKMNAKQELAEIRQRVKDIDAARSSQTFRLEQSWVDERDWSLVDWTQHFLHHPLRRLIVTALVWRAVNGDGVVHFMADGDAEAASTKIQHLAFAEPGGLRLQSGVRCDADAR